MATEMYNLNACTTTMTRGIITACSRIALRIGPEQKAILLRAAALKHTDLKDSVLQHALSAAKKVIEEAEQVQLSEPDSVRVLELLEHPPVPHARLLAAARALTEHS